MTSYRLNSLYVLFLGSSSFAVQLDLRFTTKQIQYSLIEHHCQLSSIFIPTPHTGTKTRMHSWPVRR
ncbi:hypothetical protein M758_5G191800 [Ceratodon purpureus]|uniref:Secreted protein n=1 Tax=Ceratodon purpureus TaxID=3225 RepID=A0A8T0I4I2_CERPU|nr:hypothetical protein KC19_5G198900 [Ceratodon purpureus]KAG0617475.1 hypothetical protein M758_5G191800 [Ceratodon purpureus]